MYIIFYCSIKLAADEFPRFKHILIHLHILLNFFELAVYAFESSF